MSLGFQLLFLKSCLDQLLSFCFKTNGQLAIQKLKQWVSFEQPTMHIIIVYYYKGYQITQLSAC